MQCNLISVITISYQDIAGLKRTWASINSQDFERYEWIVIDGGSIDGTVEYLNALPGGSVRFKSEPDRGIYDAMRKGLDLASGQYVIFLNAGDELSGSDALRQAEEHLDGQDAVFFSARVVGLRRPRIRRPRPLASAKYSVPAIQQSTLYKAETLRSLRWPLEYRICGDYAIAAQLLKLAANSDTAEWVLSTFYLGGVSTWEVFALNAEAVRVQRSVLGLSRAYCLLASIRRLFTGYVVLFLYKLNNSRAVGR